MPTPYASMTPEQKANKKAKGAAWRLRNLPARQ